MASFVLPRSSFRSMSARQTRFLLQVLSVALLLGSLLAIVWAALPPAPELAAVAAASTRKPAAEVVSSPELDELARFWDRRLQGPLYDSAPLAVPAEELDQDGQQMQRQELATLPTEVTLVGTMREEGKSLAIFMHPDGKIDLKQAGESVAFPDGNMRVERIESSQVTLKGDSRSLVLRLAQTGVQ